MKKLCMVVMMAALLIPLPAKGGKVAVVLGGGGARGYAEVALLEKIEAYGIPVDMILGTSIGALVGSMYATGYTPSQIAGYVQSHNILAIVLQPVAQREPTFSGPMEKHGGNVISLSFGENEIGEAPNMSQDQGVLAMMNELYGSKAGITDFDKLDIPFRAIATDALTGERIVYSEGSLVTAVRSSLSIPLVFAPYPQENGSYAIDGGMVDNLPIDLARELGADYVIAMDVSPNVPPQRKDMQTFLGVAGRLLAFMTPSMEYQYPNADILVIPDLENTMQTMLEFDNFQKMYQAGKSAVDAKDDAFRLLAEKLEKEGRVLTFKDPDRAWSWNEDERTISGVEVRDRSGSEHAFTIEPESFDFMVGKHLDGKSRQRLVEYLEKVKYTNKLSSVGYEVRHDEDPDTETLIVNYEFYDIPSNRFQLSAYGSFGLSNNNYVENTPLWLGFQLRESFTFSDVTRHHLDFVVDMKEGNATSLSLGAFFPAFATGSRKLSFGLEMEGGIGSYSPMTHDGNSERLSPIDQNVDIRFCSTYTYANILQLKLLGGWRYTYLHHGERMYHMGYASLGMVLDTHIAHSLVEPGFRFSAKLENGLTFPDDTFWLMQVETAHNFAFFRNSQMVGYAFRFALMDGHGRLSQSYVDVGGYDGMPGYRYGTLRHSAAITSLRYRAKLPLKFVLPVAFLSRVAIGVADDHEPFEGDMHGGYFSSADWDFGIEAGLGLQTPLGNIACLVGCSVDGNMSFSIGIIE